MGLWTASSGQAITPYGEDGFSFLFLYIYFFHRRGPRHYVPDAMSHGDRCIVLKKFGQIIYFCKIVIEKI
jgi:hypothetical protein